MSVSGGGKERGEEADLQLDHTEGGRGKHGGVWVPVVGGGLWCFG